MRFVLASGSASRRQILTNAGVLFEAVPADIDEDALKDAMLREGVPVAAVAGRLAEAKARDVANRHSDALVLGADQTLLFDDGLVSKCADLSAARALLKRLKGRTHQLVGGYVMARGGATVWRHEAVSTLTMRSFSDAFLDRYLAEEGEGLLSAVGCYKLEGLGAQLFERVEGDYFAVLGLDLQPVLAELRRQGVLDE